MKNVKGANAIPRTKAGKFWGSTTRNNANVKKNMNANVQRFALLKDELSNPDNDSYDQEAADYFFKVAERARDAVERDKGAAREIAERAAKEHREAEEEAARAEAEAAAAAEAEAAAEGLSRRDREAAEAASKKAEAEAEAAAAVAAAAARVAAKARYEALCAEDAAFCSLEGVRNERTRRAIVGTGPVYMTGNTKNFSNSNVSKIRAQLLKEYPEKGMNATSYATKLQDMLFMILSRGSWDALPNADLRKKLGKYRQSLTGPTNLTRRALVERVFRNGAKGAIGVANAAVPRLSGNATAAAAAAEDAVAAASKTLKERESTNPNSSSFNSGRSDEAEELNRRFVNMTRGLTPRQVLNAKLAEERARRAAARRGSGVASTVQSGLASRFGPQTPRESYSSSFTGTWSRPSSASRSTSSSLANAIRAGQQRRGTIFDSARSTSGRSASRRGSMSSRGSRASSQGRPRFDTAARVAGIHNKGVGMGNAAAKRRGQTNWSNPFSNKSARPPPIPPGTTITSAALSRGLPPLLSRTGMDRNPPTIGQRRQQQAALGKAPTAIQQELAQQENALKRAGANEAAAELGKDEEEIFSSTGFQLPGTQRGRTAPPKQQPQTAWQNGTTEEDLQGGRRGTYRRSKSKSKGKGKSKRHSRK